MGDLPATATLVNNVVATGVSLALAALTPSPTAPSSALVSGLGIVEGDWAMPEHHHGDDAPNGECSLLGPFALIVQAALGGMALLALVFKRWRERPQRPLKIWSFDVSKQVVGSVLVHIANLLMSMLSSGQFSIKVDPTSVSHTVVTSMLRRAAGEDGEKYQPNPCSFYLLNLAIDTTVGIPILIILLRVFTGLFRMTSFGSPPESIQSGNYGSPPRASWWFKQSLIYFLGLMGMKLCVLVIFLVLPWISRIGDWALRWTEGNEELQVFFVMLFFPVIMNATQYYIIDSFIKNQNPDAQHERVPDEDPENYDGAADFDERSGSSEEIDTDDEEDVPEVKQVKSKTKFSAKKLSGDHHIYDEQFDGDSSPTTVVGSGSNSEGGKFDKSLQSDGEEEGVTKKGSNK